MKTERIKRKIKLIEKLLSEIADELDACAEKKQPKTKRQHRVREVVATEEELRSEYERLYWDFVDAKPELVRNFVKEKSKAYLEAFCEANSVPIDARKASKEKIAETLLQWLAQRRAVTRKVW